MRKQVFGRQLKRDVNERKALFKGLMSSLVLEERIETTEEKAKSIKAHVEKLVTKAKKNGVASARLFYKDLNPAAVTKLVNDVAPRFAQRNGGYTRILKLGKRFGDDASMVIMEWVEKKAVVAPVAKEKAVKAEAKPEVTEKSVRQAQDKPAAKKTTTKTEKKAPKKTTKKETK